MKQIDRLLIEAKKIAGYTGKQLTLAMVERCGASWAAVAHLWDRKPGHSPTVEATTHATMDAAVEHIHAIAREYPNSQDIGIIVDDIPG